LARVTIHNMVSADERMNWITPDVGLYYEVAGRWQVDAILSGSDTILVGLGDLEAPEEELAYLQGEGVEFILAGKDHIDFRAALEALYSRHGVRTVRVDSGGTLDGVLLREGLVDEISLLIEPSLVGGTPPRSFFVAPDLRSPEDLIHLRLAHVKQLRDGTVWIHYDITRS
jgi:2,5-diamino-6-(ribosylamino)-4(3H)-pyrimidinone 5'-phosphate reductase